MGADVRSNARSSWGSKTTGVAEYKEPSTRTCGWDSPAMTCALVTTTPGFTSNAVPSCVTPQAPPMTFTVEVRAPAAIDSACDRGGDRHWRGQLRRELGEDGRHPLLAQERLDVGENRRHGRHHLVDRAQHVGPGDGRTEPRVARLGEHASEHPGREQHRDHGDGHAEAGVQPAEVVALQGHVAPPADDAPAHPEEGRRAEHDHQRHDRLDRPRVQRGHEGDGKERAEDQPQPEAPEGEDLDEGPEPEAVDPSGNHRDQKQQVDPVHCVTRVTGDCCCRSARSETRSQSKLAGEAVGTPSPVEGNDG